MLIRHRLALFVAAAAAATAALAACGSSGGGTTSASTSTTPKAAGSSHVAQPSPPAAQGSTMTATLTEFKITLATEALKAGTYTFQVKNAGNITHALTIDGPGVSDSSTGDLSPGSSKTLTVTLRAGKYDFFCPVGDHKMEGMDDTVTVS